MQVFLVEGISDRFRTRILQWYSFTTLVYQGDTLCDHRRAIDTFNLHYVIERKPIPLTDRLCLYKRPVQANTSSTSNWRDEPHFIEAVIYAFSSAFYTVQACTQVCDERQGEQSVRDRFPPGKLTRRPLNI